jgi:prevent-host-death family protein
MYLKTKNISNIGSTRAKLTSLVKTAEEGEPVAITKNGEPVVVMISAKEYDRIQEIEHILAQDLDLDVIFNEIKANPNTTNMSEDQFSEWWNKYKKDL